MSTIRRVATPFLLLKQCIRPRTRRNFGLTTIPRRTVSVTVADGREPIVLLVVPPDTPTETAWADMNIAATSPGIPLATGILTPQEIQAR